jgi:hypothetical protein
VTAPVQVLVIGFDPPAFSGEVLAELARLRQAGIVRLLDLLLVERRPDGTIETLDGSSELTPGSGALAAAILCDGGAVGSSDVAEGSGWSLGDVVPAGSVAAVALIEHLWAGPLSAAIARAGGTPLEEAWLAPQDLEALDALTASR